MPGPRAPKILFMPLEFPSWEKAKPHSYTAQFGLEEGLLASGAQTFVVPAFPSPLGGRDCWPPFVPELAAGLRFDQAWLGLVHARYEPEFCEWLVANVPVRVGLLTESMTYTPEECRELPPLAGRAAHVLRQVASLGLTHVLCCDERDVEAITAAGVPALWLPTAVPARCITAGHIPPQVRSAAFFGDLYSEERRRLADLPAIQGLLNFPRGPERDTDLPARFDALHAGLSQALRAGQPALGSVHAHYIHELRDLRRAIFAAWMSGLPAWTAVVNLPSYFKGYAGRVAEAMAMGVPVVSWRVPDRPRNLALFEDGREILLFDREQVEPFLDHLDRLGRDPDFARQLAERARQKMLRCHTSEFRARQILDWVLEDREPAYA